MVKFATFESAVAKIYQTLGKPKESYNTLQQTGVSFLGGYIAGIGCAVVSHPAGTLTSPIPIIPLLLMKLPLIYDLWQQTSWSPNSIPIEKQAKAPVKLSPVSIQTLDSRGCGTVYQFESS